MWQSLLKRLFGSRWDRNRPNPTDGDVGEWPGSGGLGLGAILNALDWDHVREEVDQESRARIVLIGAAGAGKTTLLNHLRGFELSPPVTPGEQVDTPVIEDFGLFAVVDVPSHGPGGAMSEGDATWLTLQNGDLVLWMLDGTVGLRPWEYEWMCRIRAMGRPLAAVLNKVEHVENRDEIDRLSRMLACKVISISARDGTNIASRLLPHIVNASPGLNTALGREAPAWRRMAAQRATRRAMDVSGLVGVEPVPLLDIPFQVLIQLRLVLRLAAIYGEPLGDPYSRELLATIVSGVGLRYLGQQLAKVIPLLGWIVSGGLAAGGTWAIGRIALEYFENGRQVTRMRTANDRLQAAGRRQPTARDTVKATVNNLRSQSRDWLSRQRIITHRSRGFGKRLAAWLGRPAARFRLRGRDAGHGQDNR